MRVLLVDVDVAARNWSRDDRLAFVRFGYLADRGLFVDGAMLRMVDMIAACRLPIEPE